MAAPALTTIPSPREDRSAPFRITTPPDLHRTARVQAFPTLLKARARDRTS
jgi:hypothetical protein